MGILVCFVPNGQAKKEDISSLRLQDKVSWFARLHLERYYSSPFIWPSFPIIFVEIFSVEFYPTPLLNPIGNWRLVSRHGEFHILTPCTTARSLQYQIALLFSTSNLSSMLVEPKEGVQSHSEYFGVLRYSDIVDINMTILFDLQSSESE